MKIENLTVSYGKTKVFENLNISFNDGEITCVLGRSGVGKTTLLNYIAGLGSVKPSEEIPCSMVFQEPRLVPNLTVKENLLFAGCSELDIEKGLEMANLKGKQNERPTKLSGGEKQRVNFLRAVLNNAPVVLLDEPFSSLDLSTKIPLMNEFVKMLKQAKKTAILVTHDVEEALVVADRILVLDGGEITLDISLKTTPPRAYGVALFEREQILNKIL